MDNKQLAQVFGAMRFIYPKYFATLNEDDLKGLINAWAVFFADDDAVVFTKAMRICACTNTFFPSIADVKEQIVKLTQPAVMSEQEAWSTVREVLGYGASNTEKAWNDLPEPIQKAVGSPSMLRQWALMNEDTVDSVIASNFQRSYKTIAKRESELRLLPSDIRSEIKALADKRSANALPEIVSQGA